MCGEATGSCCDGGSACPAWCRFIWSLRANVFSQYVHLNGLSPEREKQESARKLVQARAGRFSPCKYNEIPGLTAEAH
eukprot:m.482096 g.482096  ORF g.482096 m.482096 type:complete len:78 (+) comp57185_c0_seq5:44-277(+)